MATTKFSRTFDQFNKGNANIANKTLSRILIVADKQCVLNYQTNHEFFFPWRLTPIIRKIGKIYDDEAPRHLNFMRDYWVEPGDVVGFAKADFEKTGCVDVPAFTGLIERQELDEERLAIINNTVFPPDILKEERNFISELREHCQGLAETNEDHLIVAAANAVIELLAAYEGFVTMNVNEAIAEINRAKTGKPGRTTLATVQSRWMRELGRAVPDDIDVDGEMKVGNKKSADLDAITKLATALQNNQVSPDMAAILAKMEAMQAELESLKTEKRGPGRPSTK
jgi:hypothetical protein